MERDLKKLLKEYLDAYTTTSLATASSSGAVNCATVCYAVDSEGRVVFASDPGTTKARHLQQNPRAALTMQDGGRTMRGVQLRGVVRLIDGTLERDAARHLLKQRNPDVAAFYDNQRIGFYSFTAEESFLINFTWGVDWRQLVR